MKRLLAFVAAVGALTVAACDDPYEAENLETAQPPLEEPVAPSAEDAAADAAAAAAADAPPPVDQSPLPADKRTSEQSVQPESETLFY